jgi:hypothetical protein
LHVRRTRLRHSKRALANDINDVAHFIGVRLIGRCPVTVRVSTIDKTIDSTEGFDTRRDQALALLCGRDVSAQSDRFPTRSPDFLRHRIKKILTSCAKHDRSTLLGGHFRQRLSKSWANPTDHHHFIFEQHSTTSLTLNTA